MSAKSKWLEPKKKRTQRAAGATVRVAVLGAVAAVTVATLVLAFSVDQRAENALEDGKDPTALDSLAAAIKSALQANSWPELTPSMDSVVAGYQRDDATNACSNQVFPGLPACTWGAADAPHSVVIVGDSTSASYVPMLRALSDGTDGQLKVSAFGMYGCPFVDFETTNGGESFNKACPGRKEQAMENIVALKPGVVIVANTYLPLKKTSTGETFTPGECANGLRPFLERIEPNTGKIVLLAPPPAEKDVRECYSPRTGPAACVTTVPARWKAMGKVEAALAADVRGAWIDTRPLFCATSRRPAFASGIPVKFDDLHLTEEYSRHIAPGFVALLAQQQVSLTGG